MNMLKRYEKNVPVAYMQEIITAIDKYAVMGADGLYTTPNEIYISRRQYAILDALFKIPNIEKELERCGLSMFYEPHIVPDPEYFFQDSGFITTK